MALFEFERFDENIVFIDHQKHYSYKQLASDCTSIEQYLGRRKLALLFLQNTYDSLCVYFSLLRSNNVVMIVDYQLDDSLCSRIINRYSPNYIIGNNNKVPSGNRLFGSINIKVNCNIQHDIYEELAIMLSTSGSTGTPRFVRLSHQNLETNTKSIISALNIQPFDRAITTLPPSYTYGLSIIHSHISIGGSVILNNFSILDNRFWDLVNTKKATTFGGVPYSYRLLELSGFDKRDVPSLRYITQAGGRLSGSALEYCIETCTRKNIKFFKMYGQVEATARISVLDCEKNIAKLQSVGQAIEGVTLSIVDDFGNDITDVPNSSGNIKIQSNSVMLGYSDCLADLSLEDKLKGENITGDIGYIDCDGFLFIIGRKNRMIKVNGKRINLEDIEIVLQNMATVECACSGTDDKLIIYALTQHALTNCKNIVSSKIGIPHFMIDGIVVPTIPRTSSGKINYFMLQHLTRQSSTT